MPNLLDIGTSAILAYRMALTTTGENIANADTEGFTRRDVQVGEVIGGQMTPTSRNSGGQGVIVEDVRRAFDSFLAERVWSTSGDFASAESFHSVTRAIEDLFLPSVGGIASGLDQFFRSLSTLSGNPSDYALRQSVLEAGNAMTSSISNVAVGLMALRADTVTQAETAATMLNEKLEALADLQRGMTGASNSNGGLNPIFDRRDKLLGDISEIIGNKVDMDEFGRVQIHLGDTLGGPLLLETKSAAIVELDTATDLRMVITRAGEQVESTQINSGMIEGYRNALLSIDEAVTQLNAFARRVARDINTLHNKGLDASGTFGGDIFTLNGWDATPVAANRGTTFVDFTVTDAELSNALGSFTITYDGVNGLWNATDATGTTLSTGASVLTLDGLTLTLRGTPADGDRLQISPVVGRAMDMKMGLTAPEELAAAAASLVAPLASNTGTGSAVMAQIPVAAPPLTDLADILTVAGTGADAVSLLSPGVVGFVPAGSDNLSLSVMAQQSTQDFSVSDAQAAGATSLSFSIGGTGYSFDLSSVGAATAEDLAAALNSGAVTTAAGETLSDLGVHAAGTSGSFSLALGIGDFDATATLGSSAGASSGVLTDAQSAGGTLQVFTRNGVQLAGPPLDATAAAALLSEENGFFDGATYIDDYLYTSGTDGYRGMTRVLQQLPGAETLKVSLADAQTWVNADSLPPISAAQSLTMAYVDGDQRAYDLPAGISAARVAATIGADIDGMIVDADTSVDMTVDADGAVSFLIEGTNVETIKITGQVSSGRLDSIALAVNARTGATGVSASLSQDGTRIVLNHADGENITIKGYEHSAGGLLSLTPATEEGLPSGTSTVLGGAVDSVVLTGTVSFEAPSAFGVEYDSAMLVSSTTSELGGLVAHSYEQARDVQNFSFSTDSRYDAGAASVDGLAAMGAGTEFSLSVGGVTATYTGDSPAAGLATALRSAAPQSWLLGQALTSLPSTGAATSVKLGEDTYVLRMTSAGDIAVTGPEDGRISAEFNASNRLVLSVKDGTLDGATLQVPTGTSGAAAFGLTGSLPPTSVLDGQDMDSANLPATMQVEVAGTVYDIPVSTAGASVPGGFPGTAVMVGGKLEFRFGSSVGPVRVLPSAGATAAGFATLGMKASVEGDNLTLTSTSGEAIDADISITSTASQRLSMTGMPDEDLIVVMTGSSPLRLAGSYDAGTVSAYSPSVRVDVVDADAGLVRLVDNDTGHTIGERTLDSSNAAIFGGVQVALGGAPDSGDGFVMMANNGFTGDGRNINAMAELRNADPTTGEGGFGRILAALQAQKGAVVSAAKSRVDVTDANREGAERVYADRTAVDLDEQAARLVDQQQAYQASAQILSVANELFDTLLNSL